MPLKSANRSGCAPTSCSRCSRVCLQQVVDQHLGVDFLLDVERRRVHHEVGPVLLILAAPDQLRVQVAVAALVGHADGALLLLLHHRLIFGGGDVLAPGLLVRERFDGLRALFFVAIAIVFRHGESRIVTFQDAPHSEISGADPKGRRVRLVCAVVADGILTYPPASCLQCLTAVSIPWYAAHEARA